MVQPVRSGIIPGCSKITRSLGESASSRFDLPRDLQLPLNGPEDVSYLVGNTT
jgi:hypothetical protein